MNPESKNSSPNEFSMLFKGASSDFGLDSFHFDNPTNFLFKNKEDRDEVCALVGGILKPHSLQVIDNEILMANMYHIPMGALSLFRLSYGASVQISPLQFEKFFLVTMPLRGKAFIQTGKYAIDANPNLAAVLNPSDELKMNWSSDHEQVILKVSCSLLEQTLSGYLGHSLEKPLVFELGFRWQENTAWRRLMNYLLACATQFPDLERNPLILSQLEQMTACALLHMHRHSYSDTSSKRRITVLPRHVRRAQDYLQAHAHEPVTTLLLAQVAGVSTRSLHGGFKQFLETSPMQYLRDVRLERVRAELLMGTSDRVASIALRWGFEHMGRFAKEYKRKYGETPSETLNR